MTVRIVAFAFVSLLHVSFSLTRINVIEEPINDSPIVGVLSQEFSSDDFTPGLADTYKSYVAASYVKFVEGSGARVVPIRIGEKRNYYEEILNSVNGVLFPGGNASFDNSDGYAAAGKHIYEVAKQINDEGDYLPLWGTCLGFELLNYVSILSQDIFSACEANNQSLPLNFSEDFTSSKMFMNAPDFVIGILQKEPVTSNFHSYCITEKNFTKFHLNDIWKIISTNKDANGLNFISAIESKNYPFYGTQFHPEKNIYEWIGNKNIMHTKNAIEANRYFADFFVNEARKNNHEFKNKGTEESSLIYNFPATYTALNGSVFEQCYFFY